MVGMTVGQLAGHAGLSADTIRSYLEIGLLPEPPTSANARRFPAETLDRLTLIKDAQRVGLSRDDMKWVIAARDEGRCPGALTRRLLGQRLDDVDGRIARLTAQREDVAAGFADPAVLHDQACVMAADKSTDRKKPGVGGGLRRGSPGPGRRPAGRPRRRVAPPRRREDRQPPRAAQRLSDPGTAAGRRAGDLPLATCWSRPGSAHLHHHPPRGPGPQPLTA